MERAWMVAQREARYETLDAAARAAKVGAALLRRIECGDVTGPGIACRIGMAYGMNAGQIIEITCRETVERRRREAGMSRAQIQRDRLREVYTG